MSPNENNIPRLAVIACNAATDHAFAKTAAVALTGRILLALAAADSKGTVQSTGFDFVTSDIGSSPADYPSLLLAAGVNPDQTVIVRDDDGLRSLVRLLPPTVRYRVLVESPDEETGKAFLAWVTEEHAPELLALPGCSDFRICKVSEKELACEYLFTSEKALKTYYNEFAETMRGRYKLKFPAVGIRFTREEAIVAGCGFKRDAADYSS